MTNLKTNWTDLQQTSLEQQNELENHKLAYLKQYSNWIDKARAEQITPEGDWTTWLILAGRGWGKTTTGAFDTCLYALRYPESQIAVVTPTFGDLRRVAFGGISGLLSIIPHDCLVKGKGQGYNQANNEIKLVNGSKIMGFSSTEPDRLRGVQFHRAWCDELCAWQYPDTFDQLLFALRLGVSPKVVITTTPKPNMLIKNLVKNKDTFITKGTTFDNADNLSPQAIASLKEKYGNTRLGRQELYGEVLDDVEGALWSYSMIDKNRISKDQLPELKRIVVAIDPAVTSNENSDHTGIIVAGRGLDNRFYVLEDATIKAMPDKWMRKAIDLFYLYNADRIVAEVNNGGDLVERLLRTIDTTIAYKKVQASRGKMIRAEPISALYEQDKVSHVGMFTALEEQLCTYAGQGGSPDRLDALVWALTELNQSSGQVYWKVS